MLRALSRGTWSLRCRPERTAWPRLHLQLAVGHDRGSCDQEVPDLRLVPTGDDSHPWGVEHQRDELARFGDIGKASAYLAFMRGETIEPRVFR